MRALPLGLAVIVVAVGILRWRSVPPLIRAAAVLAVAVLVAYGVGLFDLPDFEKLLADVGDALGRWTYLLVGGLVFLETGAFIGLLAPGEVAAIAGGVVAGQGVISVVPLILLVWVCCMAGDNLSFWLGRKLGRGWLVKHGPRVRITEERLRAVEHFFARRGGLTILIGRFVGFVRPLAPFIAGASKMSAVRFAAYDFFGAGIWSTTFILLGYAFWRNFDKATEIASTGSVAIGGVLVVVVGVLVLRARKNGGHG